MGDGQHRAAFVVGQQRKRPGIVGLREDVDDRQTVSERADRGALVGAARGNHEPIDAFSQKLVEMLALALGIVSGVAHEDRYAGFRQPLLQRLDDRKGEPPETVIGDDADRARLRAVQALRQVVRPIADLARDAHHLFARLLAEPAARIERFRCRADRHIGKARDVADSRSSAKSEESVGRPSGGGGSASCMLFDRPAEKAGHVVFLQQQIEGHAGDDRDGDAGLEHAPVGAADAGLLPRRGKNQRQGE